MKQNPIARRKHARVRAVERYGIELTKKTRREILLLIRQGKILQSRRISTSRSIHKVEYQGQTIVLVYSRTTKDIVTVLPPDCRELAETDPEVIAEAAAKAEKEEADAAMRAEHRAHFEKVFQEEQELTPCENAQQ